MTEPKRYPSAPVELPLRLELEPTPVEGCAGCTELAKVRGWARASGDMTTVTDCNVYLRRHPEGHRRRPQRWRSRSHGREPRSGG